MTYKDHISLILSVIAIIFSGLTLFINLKKYKQDKLNSKKEFERGAAKILELTVLIGRLKNTDVQNITFEKFQYDKDIIYEILKKYMENEVIISKVTHAFPRIIFDIQKTINKIEDNFKNETEHEFYTPKVEILMNYSKLFFNFSLFFIPFGDYNYTNEKVQFQKYRELSNIFIKEKYMVYNNEVLNKI